MVKKVRMLAVRCQMLDVKDLQVSLVLGVRRWC